ncbi:MAG: hypothetical protein B9S33_14485, partial [Pedosphaera sp. Tous-C6FEB]
MRFGAEHAEVGQIPGLVFDCAFGGQRDGRTDAVVRDDGADGVGTGGVVNFEENFAGAVFAKVDVANIEGEVEGAAVRVVDEEGETVVEAVGFGDKGGCQEEDGRKECQETQRGGRDWAGVLGADE